MIPPERVSRALLNVERRDVIDDITQIEAAILHLLTGGKDNYDAAKESNDRQEDYSATSEKILKDLEKRLEERKKRVKSLDAQLALLDE